MNITVNKDLSTMNEDQLFDALAEVDGAIALNFKPGERHGSNKAYYTLTNRRKQIIKYIKGQRTKDKGQFYNFRISIAESDDEAISMFGTLTWIDDAITTELCDLPNPKYREVSDQIVAIAKYIASLSIEQIPTNEWLENIGYELYKFIICSHY